MHSRHFLHLYGISLGKFHGDPLVCRTGDSTAARPHLVTLFAVPVWSMPNQDASDMSQTKAPSKAPVRLDAALSRHGTTRARFAGGCRCTVKNDTRSFSSRRVDRSRRDSNSCARSSWCDNLLVLALRQDLTFPPRAGSWCQRVLAPRTWPLAPLSHRAAGGIRRSSRSP